MVTIREATVADVPMIARVHVDTWRTTYRGIIPEKTLAQLFYSQREKSWLQIISNAQDAQFTYIACDRSGQIIGFADGGLGTEHLIYKGELNAIYILETYQRQGIGRRLFHSVVKRLETLNINSMLVWILADNPACIFYESLGGQPVDEKQIERGGVTLNEVAYGWKDTQKVR